VAKDHTYFVGAGRVLAHNCGKVLQTGGNKLNKRTADQLNERQGENLPPREWGRTLEALKGDLGLPPNHHGKILDNGDYLDDSGNLIGSLLDYIP